MKDVPKLRENQIGVIVKVHNESYLKLEDETLYCTVNGNSISLELYPKKPIIIIDKDVAKMLLKKIADVEEMVTEDKLDISTLSAHHFNGGAFNNRPDYIKAESYFPENINTTDVGTLK